MSADGQACAQGEESALLDLMDWKAAKVNEGRADRLNLEWGISEFEIANCTCTLVDYGIGRSIPYDGRTKSNQTLFSLEGDHHGNKRAPRGNLSGGGNDGVKNVPRSTFSRLSVVWCCFQELGIITDMS
ncbi:hypothetical protein TCAL_16967 [Tigriopus californicus]|uniref:Uncharacterized protein n=1 Tax=Tigriopus californicus TaxID=6832 RepID=A0A553PI37_TIGCA|nr:hypothetical protein TCAL_16967 [Tigriopus californicus]